MVNSASPSIASRSLSYVLVYTFLLPRQCSRSAYYWCEAHGKTVMGRTSEEFIQGQLTLNSGGCCLGRALVLSGSGVTAVRELWLESGSLPNLNPLVTSRGSYLYGNGESEQILSWC